MPAVGAVRPPVFPGALQSCLGGPPGPAWRPDAPGRSRRCRTAHDARREGAEILDTAARPPARQRGEARRRYLTLLFADLTGSTRLGAALEAEHYASILDALAAVYREVIPRHGGVVSRVQGDGVLAVFGHPETREDDGRRATEAALELHARVRQLRLDPAVAAHGPLSLHSGIHAGVVLVGKGDSTRGRFELMGNVPNIAARLSDAAAADEILVSEETLGPHVERFVVAAQRLLQPAGAPAAVVALHVVGLTPSAPDGQPPVRSRHRPDGFSGRQAELARLQAALDEARGGRTRRIALVGAAGLGKSRLAQAFLDHCAAQGCTVLRGCLRGRRRRGADAAVPADAARPRRRRTPCRHAGDGTGSARRRNGSGAAALPGRAGTAAGAHRRGAAPHRRNARRARAPLVVFIDDWQWADDASHQLLSSVLGRQRADADACC